MNLKFSVRHTTGFVEVCEFFAVGDLFGEEIGVVQIADKGERIILGLDVFHAFVSIKPHKVSLL
jgi:hypothetical protein